jgi:hypothetical protein
MEPPAEPWLPLRRRSGGLLAAGLGAAWGLAGYAVLWGYTPLTIHRSFVVSAAGTIVLLPVRAVLAGIGVVEERIAGHPFQLAETHGWIGLVAAAVGAALAGAGFLVVRGLVRRVSRRSAAP